jgi:phytoene dehydrogenase-like protein
MKTTTWLRILAGMAAVLMSWLFAQAQTAATPLPEARIKRGQYLVERVANCADCHTERDWKGKQNRERWLRGARLDFKPVYVLVPVPNRTAGVDWPKETAAFRDRVIAAMETRGGMKDLRQHIREEIGYTPQTWQDMNIQFGATFNLAHSLGQMLYFRPRNKFEELDHCCLVGGGTHPGSGLPTIYESGRIAANLIARRHGVEFVSKNTQV